MCKDFDECVLQDDCVHPYVESLIRLELFELADTFQTSDFRDNIAPL
jgi:hypothetical protein